MQHMDPGLYLLVSFTEQTFLIHFKKLIHFTKYLRLHWWWWRVCSCVHRINIIKQCGHHSCSLYQRRRWVRLRIISFFSDLILQSESYQSWETESSAARSCGEKDWQVHQTSKLWCSQTILWSCFGNIGRGKRRKQFWKLWPTFFFIESRFFWQCDTTVSTGGGWALIWECCSSWIAVPGLVSEHSRQQW